MNIGAVPFDPNSPVGRVRLLVGDTDPSNTGEYLWYSDSELTALLDQYGGNAPRVAARVINTIARSQSLLLKKWTSADLAVDGPAITRALIQSALTLEEDARRFDADGSSGLVLVPTGGVDRTAFALGSFAITSEDAERLFPRMV